jgi:hypothetical protein
MHCSSLIGFLLSVTDMTIEFYLMGYQGRFRSSGTSDWSDQDLHCSLFDYKIISDHKANSVEPDLSAGMCQLIWIYTVHTCDNVHIYEEKG